MKTIKNNLKGILAGAMIVLALSASANDNYFKLSVMQDKIFSLSVANVNGAASISITDEEGNVLFNEDVETSGRLNRRYDLSALPNGTYELSYEDNFKVQSVSFLMEDAISFGEEKVSFVPVISNDGTSLKVGLLSQSESKMYVSVFDVNNRLILSEVLKGDQYFGKGYDLSKIRKGTYTVLVSTDGRSYSRIIKI